VQNFVRVFVTFTDEQTATEVFCRGIGVQSLNRGPVKRKPQKLKRNLQIETKISGQNQQKFLKIHTTLINEL